MKIVSWNVNGLRSIMQKGFTAWLDHERPDIVCLQETKLSGGFDTSVLSDRGYFIYKNNSSKPGYSGTMILSKRELVVELNPFGTDEFKQDGRVMLARLDGFTLLNLYMPHGSRDKSRLLYKLDGYQELYDFLKRESHPVVVVGDLNIAHKDIDLARPKQNTNNVMFTAEERSSLTRIMDTGIVDCYRSHHKGGSMYTWWPYAFSCRERNVGWRIDYALVSDVLMKKVSSVSILSDVFGSDHCPICLDIDLMFFG